MAAGEETVLHVARRPPRRFELGTIHSVLTAGSHHPLLCQLEDGGPAPGLWVVKPQNHVSSGDRRAHLSVLAELAAAEVCSWIGLPTPAIGVLAFPKRVPAEEYAHLPEALRKEVAELLALNAGTVAFCSRYLEPAVDLRSDILKRASKRKLALGAGAKMYALDGYIRHDDRTVDCPNALFWRDQIVAIDHGNAFVWLDRVGYDGESVARLTRPMPGCLRHVVREALDRAGDRVSFVEFEQQISAVADRQIDDVAKNWPDELDVPVQRGGRGLRTEMVVFLKARRARVSEVVRAVVESLGGSP